MFRPDQPIENEEEDILGRKPFANALAKAILDYRNNESVAIGLFGKWGSGKTSIINLAIEQIEEDSQKLKAEEKPIIIRFNPWNFSDQAQLISQYFKQLSIALEKSDYNEKFQKAGKTIEVYAKFFEPLTYIPPTTVLGVIAKWLSRTGKNISAAAESSRRNLDGIKKDLEQALKDQEAKIIIVIDDIDRLNDMEIRQIFQLVKSLGDFPNTIYLLAFDKDVVINALNNVQRGYGNEYLEKIVQVPFEVSAISRIELENLLFSQLNELIKDVSEDKWNKGRWTSIYQDGLRPSMTTIRDVNRYINALRFSYEMVKKHVNAIDLLAIISLQVFEPDVYYGIRDNGKLFSGILDAYPSYSKEAEKKDAKKRIEEIFSRANEKNRESERGSGKFRHSYK